MQSSNACTSALNDLIILSESGEDSDCENNENDDVNRNDASAQFNEQIFTEEIKQYK